MLRPLSGKAAEPCAAGDRSKAGYGRGLRPPRSRGGMGVRPLHLANMCGGAESRPRAARVTETTTAARTFPAVSAPRLWAAPHACDVRRRATPAAGVAMPEPQLHEQDIQELTDLNFETRNCTFVQI